MKPAAILHTLLCVLLFLPVSAWSAAPGYTALFDGHSLAGWEVIGDGLWGVTSDGILVGQRDLKTARDQSWLYTKRDFDEFDLRATFWIRYGGNSGISIRDTSRAKYAITPSDPEKTPSHLGYEIQLEDHAGDQFHTGSVYHFDHAPDGVLKQNDWNTIEIHARHSGIEVSLNGQKVSHAAGDPARSLTGPIGLQLHDKTSVVMFKSVEIHEISPAKP